jgi:NAD(P)H dehydrogenase (quinone)
MIKPRIIVTGATGKTGGVVATDLLKAGYPQSTTFPGEAL